MASHHNVSEYADLASLTRPVAAEGRSTVISSSQLGLRETQKGLRWEVGSYRANDSLR